MCEEGGGLKGCSEKGQKHVFQAEDGEGSSIH